jgi:glycosyltransferase involved in cell wall biosynthesis
MISIIIPAHNESSVIARTLKSILEGALPNELDVIVVCNGCTDDTASIARSFGPMVRVIDTNVARKTHALNLGDEAARAFPRVYLDADVTIALEALRMLTGRLEVGDVLAVAPRASIDLVGCSWSVRAFYAIRSLLPSANEGIGGSGIYALSEAGRKRFPLFPPVTADDGFVRIQFQPHERETLTGITSKVFPPRTIKDLIATKARIHYGSFELARMFPASWERRGKSNTKPLIHLFVDPRLWGKLAIYSMVTIISRRLAVHRLRRGPMPWKRDQTSRSNA